jgi:uncharacterized short protein YbdD (DUF466 family)
MKDLRASVRLAANGLRLIFHWVARTSRLMVGVPHYETYVEHRQIHHPGEPVMTYEEFYWERVNARYAVDKGRFKGCC